mmetsp:Transcript_13230/g.24790  ORF Transcript_13230/g.24790 Transcript_13230/m.24790 type:complete len:144 (-) Transcript_13230:2620-3051(-)
MWIRIGLELTKELYFKLPYKFFRSAYARGEISFPFRRAEGDNKSSWFNYKKQSFKQKLKETQAGASISGMPREEALQVLELEENFTREELNKRYDLMFTINDPAKGGSIYLRGKVIGAREVLEQDTLKDKAKEGSEQSEEATQ